MKKLNLTISVLENRDETFGGSNEIALSGSTCTTCCCCFSTGGGNGGTGSATEQA
jgi:hypothetical protein